MTIAKGTPRASKKVMIEMLRELGLDEATIAAQLAKHGFAIEEKVAKVAAEVDYDAVLSTDGAGHNAVVKAGSWNKLQELYLSNPVMFKDVISFSKKRAPKAPKAEVAIETTEAVA